MRPAGRWTNCWRTCGPAAPAKRTCRSARARCCRRLWRRESSSSAGPGRAGARERDSMGRPKWRPTACMDGHRCRAFLRSVPCGDDAVGFVRSGAGTRRRLAATARVRAAVAPTIDWAIAEGRTYLARRCLRAVPPPATHGPCFGDANRTQLACPWAWCDPSAAFFTAQRGVVQGQTLVLDGRVPARHTAVAPPSSARCRARHGRQASRPERPLPCPPSSASGTVVARAAAAPWPANAPTAHKAPTAASNAQAVQHQTTPSPPTGAPRLHGRPAWRPCRRTEISRTTCS